MVKRRACHRSTISQHVLSLSVRRVTYLQLLPLGHWEAQVIVSHSRLPSLRACKRRRSLNRPPLSRRKSLMCVQPLSRRELALLLASGVRAGKVQRPRGAVKVKGSAEGGNGLVLYWLY